MSLIIIPFHNTTSEDMPEGLQNSSKAYSFRSTSRPRPGDHQLLLWRCLNGKVEIVWTANPSLLQEGAWPLAWLEHTQDRTPAGRWSSLRRVGDHWPLPPVSKGRGQHRDQAILLACDGFFVVFLGGGADRISHGNSIVLSSMHTQENKLCLIDLFIYFTLAV